MIQGVNFFLVRLALGRVVQLYLLGLLFLNFKNTVTSRWRRGSQRMHQTSPLVGVYLYLPC